MIRSLWEKIDLGHVNGLYISRNLSTLYSPYLDDTIKLETNNGEDMEAIISQAIAKSNTILRPRFKKWPMLKYLTCIEDSRYDIGMKCFRNLHKNYNAIFYQVSPEICLAIGSKEEITDNKKRIYISFKNNEVTGYIVFAANILSKVNFKYDKTNPIDIVIEKAISEVIATSSNETPEVLNSSNLNASEIEELIKGWEKDKYDCINIISSDLNVSPLIEGYCSNNYELKKCLDHYQYIELGMKELVKTAGKIIN